MIKKFFAWIFKRRNILEDYRREAVMVVQRIKEAVESDTATHIAKILPIGRDGKTDDKILEFIRLHIAEVLRVLQLSSRYYTDEVIRDSINNLKTIPKEKRAGYYKSIAGDIYSKYSGIDSLAAIDATQEYYKTLK